MICSRSDDVNFEHLVRVISARFLHHNVTLHLFVISK